MWICQVKSVSSQILFDEKIAGSIHFTPGCCYDDADNGNQSALHWDLVWIQRPEYGGGEIYFDDVLILSLLFFLYKEEVKDEGLFLALVLLLIS